MRLFEIDAPLKNDIDTFQFMKPRFVYDSSPLKFQNKSGIKVAQYYKMPDGLSVEEIYRYLSSILRALDTRKIKSSEAKVRMNRIVDSVKQLNPEVAAIRNDSIKNADMHVLTGVLSLFPIDDIKAYVEEEKTYRWYINQPDWPERYKMISEIESLTGAPILWVMSDKTLDRVYKEALKKFKK